MFFLLFVSIAEMQKKEIIDNNLALKKISDAFYKKVNKLCVCV